MTKKIIPLAVLIIVLGLQTTPVSAARSMSKSFKISVTLPAHVEMSDTRSNKKTLATTRADWGETTERIIIADNKEKILLQTTVAK